MSAQRSLLVFIFVILVAMGVVAGLTWANYRFALENPGGNDFLARWNGARAWLLDGRSPYDPQVSRETQRLIYGRLANPSVGEDVAHFVYPLPSMLFFGPFGLMEYLPARALWMTILEISLIALAFASLNLVGWKVSPWMAAALVLFSLLWYHGLRTVMVGQFAAINALLLVIALIFIRQGKDVAAGAFLALSTAKPQMSFLLIPLVLVWALSVRRRRILGGFFGVLGAMLVFSLLLIPDWPLQMARQVLDYPNYTDIGSPISIIANAAPGISGPLNVLLNGVLILYLLGSWVLVWGKGYRWFLWTAILTLVMTNLIAFRTATTNYVMLLPALFLLFKVWNDRFGMLGLGLIWFAILALGVGLWALFLATVEGNIEAAIMYLPFPFLCLAGVWWARWWTLRPPRLPYDELTSNLEE